MPRFPNLTDHQISPVQRPVLQDVSVSHSNPLVAPERGPRIPCNPLSFLRLSRPLVLRNNHMAVPGA